MAKHELPPERPVSDGPFDPAVLNRSVIAIPLLKMLKEEQKVIDRVRRQFPDAIKQFNSGIQLNGDYPGGLRAAVKKVRELADDAARQACELSAARVKSALKEFRKEEKARDEALKNAVTEQVIEPAAEGADVAFARLHAAVVRRLLRRCKRLDAESEPNPIIRILPTRFEVLIDLNLDHPDGRDAARQWVLENVAAAKAKAEVQDEGQEVHAEKSRVNNQYLFAGLEASVIRTLVQLDAENAKQEQERAQQRAKQRQGEAAGSVLKPPPDVSKFRAIYHIWPDFEISACINKSIATVKADAAQVSFTARGRNITWAVMDSGIQADHPHFAAHHNIDPDSPWHKDLTGDGGGPLTDENGHGTHVAGIIAGEWRAAPGTPESQLPIAVCRHLKQGTEDVEFTESPLTAISGMAPEAKLVSLKVLDEDGNGSASNLIAAIAHIQEINGHGRRLLIQGLNLSVGYSFDPEWFACGQSPLCVEVDRLVRSGVVVVVAAGNTGYGVVKSTIGASAAGLPLTINDPGNADLAITVGSTHRDMPHTYGVSYFSSKGPTGDGRLKPDLVAPGEKIVSAAAGELKNKVAAGRPCQYVETSGTSMAAPHISGVIAAFLSVRNEFIGRPETIKELFLATATDLRRDRYFQGAGLVDLMRAIQSV